MITRGINDETVAARCGCAPLTITGRRYKLKRIANNPVLTPTFTYFNYKERLDAWLKQLHGRAFSNMTFEAFRAWIQEPEGQALLARINAAIERERYTERAEIDLQGSGWRRPARQAHL